MLYKFLLILISFIIILACSSEVESVTSVAPKVEPNFSEKPSPKAKLKERIKEIKITESKSIYDL